MHKHTKSVTPKDLRFTDTGKNRSAPSTPAVSPSLSDISLPDGPATPRLYPVSLPDVDEGEPQVHRALAYCPTQLLPLDWDVAHSPHTVQLHPDLEDPEMDLRNILCAAATSPPVATMTLIHTDLLPNYAITIVPRYEAHVTVYDVLTGLYGFLRMPLSRVEYAELPIQRATAVAAAFHKRLDKFESESERRAEQLKGVKRIDLLLGAERTRFAGLSRHATQKAGEWRLYLT